VDLIVEEQRTIVRPLDAEVARRQAIRDAANPQPEELKPEFPRLDFRQWELLVAWLEHNYQEVKHPKTEHIDFVIAAAQRRVLDDIKKQRDLPVEAR
jgi:hypothetical protein